MRYWWILILGMYFVAPTSAQENQLIGRVVDATSEVPIHLATIFHVESGNGTYTNELGQFAIPVNRYPATLRVEYLGYEPQEVSFSSQSEAEQTIALVPRSFNLEAVEVLAERRPEREPFTQPRWAVRDYTIVDSLLFTLSFADNMEGLALRVYEPNGRLITSRTLNEFKGIETIYQSCQGILYLVTKNALHNFYLDKDQIAFLAPQARTALDKVLRPCVGSTPQAVFQSKEYYNGLMKEITRFDRNTGEARVFRNVIEEQKVEQYNEDILEIVYGETVNNMGDIGWRENMVIRRAQASATFYRNTFYIDPKPIHLFTEADTTIFVNYWLDQIEYYTSEGNMAGAQAIRYHKEKDWEKHTFFDPVSQQLYVLFDHPEGKELGLIDHKTGLVGQRWVIDCQFPRQFTVNRGELYYLDSGITYGQTGQQLYRVPLYETN